MGCGRSPPAARTQGKDENGSGVPRIVVESHAGSNGLSPTTTPAADPHAVSLVGGKEPFFQIAVGAVAIDFEDDAGNALGEGVVVSALGVGVGGECLLGDVVSEFCDTDKSALSHWCIPPQGLFHIAAPLCNRASESS
jgi:hypothetical protein